MRKGGTKKSGYIISYFVISFIPVSQKKVLKLFGDLSVW